MTLGVLITRPEASAYYLADQLRALWGCEARIVISPLMKIVHLEHPVDLQDVDTLIFTSVNGVQAFAGISTRRDFDCYAVGHATAKAAQALGFEPIDAAGDVIALCERMIADKVQGACLHLRGEVAAGDLVGCLRDAGITARAHVIYRQQVLAISDEAKALLAGSDPVIVPLFSPRSAELLFQSITPIAPLHIAAISANTAEKVPAHLCESLLIAERPDGAAMLAALERLGGDSHSA